MQIGSVSSSFYMTICNQTDTALTNIKHLNATINLEKNCIASASCTVIAYCIKMGRQVERKWESGLTSTGNGNFPVSK